MTPEILRGPRPHRPSSFVLLATAATVGLAACGGGGADAAADAARPVTTIGPENVVVVDSQSVE
nr:hypothetical protein [Gemmatimonadaceae bacterium]